MKKYSLNLYQNAIDSLNEGMNFYSKSYEEESKYKFCIILISNFMELILKYMVELQNPLLCYEKPSATNLNIEKTITWKQSLQILSNSDVFIKKDLIHDIMELSELRNKIIHYKFEYHTSEIRIIIRSVIGELRKLFNEVVKKDFIDDVSEETKVLLKTIEDEYLSQLHLAQADAKEEADIDGLEIADCGYCFQSDTAVERINNEIYCYFCEETDYEDTCCRCTEMFRISEMNSFGKTEDGDLLYLCDYCSDLLESDD